MIVHKTGRPTIPAERRKSATVSVKVTDATKVEWWSAANSEGIGFTTWVENACAAALKRLERKAKNG